MALFLILLPYFSVGIDKADSAILNTLIRNSNASVSINYKTNPSILSRYSIKTSAFFDCNTFKF